MTAFSALPTRLVGAAPVGPNQADRAVAAGAALQRFFFVDDGTFLYREALPASGNPYSYLWPFSHVAAASLDLLELAAIPVEAVESTLQTGLPHYWDAAAVPPGYDSYVVPPLGPGGDRYYDDAAWVGLDLVRQHAATGDLAALAQARAAFTFVVSGWDDDPSHPYPGGVFWVESLANRDRNTVSNAPSAQLALRLYALTGAPGDLDWAMKMYSWVDATLRDPADGLYWDHVALDGTIDHTKWSYNQGSMLGANAQLSALTQSTDPPTAAAYLARAEAIAEASLDYYAPAGVGLDGQGPAFNAIYFRNLLALRELTADLSLRERILDVLTGYADALWSRNRDEDDLFRFPPASPTVTVLDQAAVVEIFALSASALGQRPTPTPTTTTTAPSPSTTATTSGSSSTSSTVATSPVVASPRFTG